MRCALLIVVTGMLAHPCVPAAAQPRGCGGYGYRCVQYGSRFNIASNRHRFNRHGAAWRHDEFAQSGYYGGPGIRRNYSLGWGVQNPTCLFVGGEPAAIDLTVVPQVVVIAPPDSTPSDRRAATEGELRAAGPWDLLGEGRFAEARRLFAIAAIRDPGDAAAMAGFAVASAFRGEFDAATTAMRAAIDTDAAALRGLPAIGAVLEERIRGAAEAASRRDQRDPSGGDTAFLAAGMYWLLDDQAAALAAILAAAFRGDDEPSSRILYRELTRPPPEPPPEDSTTDSPAPVPSP